MFGFKIDQAKSLFFDRQAVTDRLPPAKRKAFSKVGGLARKIARNSIRPISKRMLGQIIQKKAELKRLPPQSPKVAKLRKEIVALQRKAHSRPGKPPKSITGLLKNNIFYAFDPAAESVVIGPALLNKSTGAQEKLEFGGQIQVGPKKVEMAARPYMGPAREKTEPKVAEFFRDSL